MSRMRNAFRDAFKKREISPDMVGNLELEKNDLLALILATASVIIPTVLIIFAVIAFIIIFMFYR
ncbi:MAG: hypothetical protein RR636_12115 [Clostridium sp.]|uniref:hypothetical protein n=1 Tax=Clostridium sp. TaxID=1506 RepID=UPI00307311F1